MKQIIQRLLGQAKPVVTLQTAPLRVLDTQEARAVAGGPAIRNLPT